MPFKSEAQRRFMFSRHPEIAKRWAKEGGNEMHNMPGIKSKGTTVSNNSPVGSAGNPASTDASSMGGMRGRSKPGRDDAISRRLSKLRDQKKGK